MINPGDLSKRVKIFAPSGQYDSMGEATPYIDTGKSAWCSIQGASGREIYGIGLSVAEVSHKIIMRWRKDIKTHTELHYGGRVFHVVYIDNVGEKNEWLSMLCKERVTHFEDDFDDNDGFDYGALI